MEIKLTKRKFMVRCRQSSKNESTKLLSTFAKYPAPTKEPLPDMAAERHEQVLNGIGEVKTALDGVTEYTNRKTQEDSECVKRTSIAHIAAEKRREWHIEHKGFESHPVDFIPKLSDAQSSRIAPCTRNH